MAGTGTSGRGRRKVIAAAVIIALFAGLPVMVTAINKTLQPQRHAEAARCLAAGENGDVSNSCTGAIVAAYCQRGETNDRNDDTCQMQRLEPGQTFTNYPAAAPEGARYRMACTAPFIPKWGPSMSNPGIQRKRCGRPEDADAA